MSEEEQEKQALEILKNTRQAWARIVNRYIKKLQKENTILQYNYNNLKEERKDCIHTDKIRDKIKELKKDMVKNGAIIDILYEILEGE